jgi:beta-galactosidase
MHADRDQVSADGEDVAMFAVEVQDAQGRVVPITDNEVAFTVTGAGRLIGVGNGDPTDHAPDKGSSRKAFSGLCMARVQSLKTGGEITVEAASPGLTPARVTIAAKAMTLRPQVAAWQREVPQGAGVTGLWRPEPPSESANTPALQFLVGRGAMVFSLHQNGSSLTGSVEGGDGGFFGGSDVPAPVEGGQVNGSSISFKAGTSTYSGTLNGDRIELDRKISSPFRGSTPVQVSGDQPAIGPAPDGSDPSRGAGGRRPSSLQVILHRVER